jgi:hypothetical protein
MLTVLQISVFSRTSCTKSASNDHNNTQRHQHKIVVTCKRWRIRKEKLFTFSAQNDLLKSLFQYCTWTLNHPVYYFTVALLSAELPTPEMLAAAKSLIECGVERGSISPEYKLLGHSQVRATDCPGAALLNEIKTWPHWDSLNNTST